MPRKVSRRALIIGAGAAVAGPLVGYGALRAACWAAGPVGTANAATLAQVMGSPEQAMRIGRLYLEAVAGPASLYSSAGSDIAEALRLDCVQTGVARLSELIGSDFAAGQVEVIDQWVLSRTELVLCGLFYGQKTFGL